MKLAFVASSLLLLIVMPAAAEVIDSPLIISIDENADEECGVEVNRAIDFALYELSQTGKTFHQITTDEVDDNDYFIYLKMISFPVGDDQCVYALSSATGFPRTEEAPVNLYFESSLAVGGLNSGDFEKLSTSIKQALEITTKFLY